MELGCGKSGAFEIGTIRCVIRLLVERQHEFTHRAVPISSLRCVLASAIRLLRRAACELERKPQDHKCEQYSLLHVQSLSYHRSHPNSCHFLRTVWSWFAW